MVGEETGRSSVLAQASALDKVSFFDTSFLTFSLLHIVVCHHSCFRCFRYFVIELSSHYLNLRTRDHKWYEYWGGHSVFWQVQSLLRACPESSQAASESSLTSIQLVIWLLACSITITVIKSWYVAWRLRDVLSAYSPGGTANRNRELMTCTNELRYGTVILLSQIRDSLDIIPNSLNWQ